MMTSLTSLKYASPAKFEPFLNYTFIYCEYSADLQPSPGTVLGQF